MQYNHYMRTDFEPDRWQPIYVISDIHGNLTALETFLNKVQVNPSNIICLGDVIDYGPNSVKCLQMIFDADIFMIAGNHERLLTDHELRKRLKADRGRESIVITEKEFEPYPDLVNAIDELRESYAFNFNGKYIHFSHSGLINKIWGDLDEELRIEKEIYFVDKNNLYVQGHTHVPEYRMHKETGAYILNCGSIGQPRNNTPRMSYAKINPDLSVEICYLTYDVDKELAYDNPRHTYYKERLQCGK